MRMAQAVTGGVVPAPAVRLLSGDPNVRGAANQPAGNAFAAAAAGRHAGCRDRNAPVSASCPAAPCAFSYGDVNADTVRVLAANGCEVLVNRRQGCCGALHGHNGYGEEAKSLARALD